MFTIGSFITSAVLIVGLFVLKDFELQNRKEFFSRSRKKLDRLSLILVKYIVRDTPQYFIRTFKYIVISITDLFSSILLKIVQFIEGHLHIAVHKVRGKKEDLVKGEPTSSYFKDVQAHKKEVKKTIEELGKVER